MSSRRPTAVASTAMPNVTGPIPVLQRAPRWTPSVVLDQATGARDTGGSLGGAFTLPGFAAASTPAPATTAAPAPAADCCG